MNKTTIQINENTLERLKALKRFDRESYDEVLNSIFDEIEEESLSGEEIEELKIALENVKKGEVKPIEQVAKELGIALN